MKDYRKNENHEDIAEEIASRDQGKAILLAVILSLVFMWILLNN